jgi:hypothetical protein
VDRARSRKSRTRNNRRVPAEGGYNGAGFNLGLLLRSRYGTGKPRGVQHRSFGPEHPVSWLVAALQTIQERIWSYLGLARSGLPGPIGSAA